MSVAQTNPSQDKTTVLQSKLHQAAVADRERRFHALYDKLSLPYILHSALALVIRNGGAAGVDGMRIEDLERYGEERFLSEIAQQLKERTYRPQPVRRVLIPKNGDRTKLRPLGIPTLRDRTVQAAAKLVLEPIFEADFQGCSFGFRPERGAHDALKAVTGNAEKGYRQVVDADIEQFFDSLDHPQMMEALRRRISDGEMLRLIYRWLKAGYVLEGKYHDTDQGSPQGGVLSPLLANVYLHAFDVAFGAQKRFLGKLTRYADDFLIQCGNRAHAERALAWAAEVLSSLKLRLHPEKTRLVEDREGFDFLGFHHRRIPVARLAREGKQVLVLQRFPSVKACKGFRQQVRERLGPPGRLRPQWREVLGEYGRFVRGWWQYFRHGNSYRVFKKLDRYAQQRLSRNLARSQPTGKGRSKRGWTFYLEHKDLQALPKLTDLGSGDARAYGGRAKALWRAV